MERYRQVRDKKASLADKDYLKHLPENSKKKSRFEELLELSNSKPQKKEQVLHALFSDEYLDLAAEACRSKFTKEMGGLKERVIETNLVKNILEIQTSGFRLILNF